MLIPGDYVDQITVAGMAIVNDCLTQAETQSLCQAVDHAIARSSGEEAVRDRGGVYAIRNATHIVPKIRAPHSHPAIRRLVVPVIPHSV